MILEYICENCGVSFASSVRRGGPRKRFCGRKCAQAFLHKKVIRVCPVCGNDFQVPLSHTGYRVTCSPECLGVWQSRPISEIENLTTLRERVRKQASQKKSAACELCGEQGVVEIVRILDEENKGNGEPENVAVLCAGCRALYERGAIEREYLLKQIKRYIHGVKVKKVKFLVDARGRLCEIFTQKDLIWRTPAHIYMTTVDYGVTKAWHLHQQQTDNFFCAFGSIQLALFDVRAESPTFGRTNEFIMNESNPLVVQIPPGVLHGFKGLHIPHSMVLNMADCVYRAEDPDEIRVSPHSGPEQTADLLRLQIPLETVPYSWARRDG